MVPPHPTPCGRHLPLKGKARLAHNSFKSREAGMNIESLCLLSSQSFAIECTPRFRSPEAARPAGGGLFPLAKRREKNSCFSHSEARLPSRSRKGRPRNAGVPQIGRNGNILSSKRRFHGDRSESFGGLPSPNHPHLPPRPAAPDRYGDLRPSMAPSPVIPGFRH